MSPPQDVDLTHSLTRSSLWGLTVGFFDAINSTCQGINRITHFVPYVSYLPLRYYFSKSHYEGDIKQHHLSDGKNTLRKPCPLFMMQLYPIEGQDF